MNRISHSNNIVFFEVNGNSY